MQEYEVRNQAGDTLAILEAADVTDAELYAHREIKGVARVVPMPSSERAEARLKESFTTIMGDEKLAELAVAGRDSGRLSPRRIIVPRQLAGGAHEELTEAQRQGQETISGGKLERAFRDMGLSESGAKIAVRGRESR